MKKCIGIFIVLMQISSCSHSQDSIIFKIQFNPETTYRTVEERSSNSQIIYAGSAESLERINSDGGQNPENIKTGSKTASISTTGKLTEGTHFTFVSKYIGTTSISNEVTNSYETTYYGLCQVGSMPIFDSVSTSKDEEEDYKVMLLETMQNYYSQMTFKERKLKIGDKFSEENPFSTTYSPTEKMIINVNYHLLGVENGIARFEFSEVHNLKSTNPDNTTKANGRGRGQFEYDIENHFIVRYQTETNSEMTTMLGDLTMTTKSISTASYMTTIERNK